MAFEHTTESSERFVEEGLREVDDPRFDLSIFHHVVCGVLLAWEVGREAGCSRFCTPLRGSQRVGADVVNDRFTKTHPW